MNCPIAIDPRTLALLVQLGEAFVDGAQSQELFEAALDDVRSELQAAGHDIDALVSEALRTS